MSFTVRDSFPQEHAFYADRRRSSHTRSYCPPSSSGETGNAHRPHLVRACAVVPFVRGLWAAEISALQIIEDVGEVAFKFVPLLMQAQARR